MCYGIIYKIENKINGKIYIGQTITSFDERYKGDIEKNTHNIHLKRSIEKYGVENFYIDKCVCKCETKEELDRVEQFYIYVYNTMDPNHGYNKREGGNGGKLSNETKQKMSESLKGENCYMWGKHLSEETKKKMSKALKGRRHSQETKQKISEAQKGEKHRMYKKHLSDEHKQKISKALSGEKNPMYGKPFSDEHKKKLSESKKGKNNPRARAVIQLDKNGNFIRKYNFIKQASRELNINCKSISDCCKGRRKYAGNYIWMYEDDFISSTTGDTLVPDINTNI